MVKEPRSKDEILTDIEKLCEELATRMVVDENIRQRSRRNNQCRRHRYTGDRVIITVYGAYRGQQGTVTGPKGPSDSPTYYNILLDNGIEIYKAPTSWRKITTT